MTLQLQAGKTYVTRLGNKYGPMVYDGDYGIFKVAGASDSIFWFKNGAYYFHPSVESTMDFVSEYVDKSAYLQKGMWYKYPPRAVNPEHLLSALCIYTTEKTAIMQVYRSEDPDDYYVNIVDIANTGRRYVPSTQPAKPQEDF